MANQFRKGLSIRRRKYWRRQAGKYLMKSISIEGMTIAF